MPTYEYRCSQGHHFEQFQRMTEPPVEKCPQCGSPTERLLSAGAGILFKGSGFYITDYRSDSYRKAAEADSEKPPAETSKPAPKEGAKTAASDGSSAKPEKKADAGAGASSPGE